MPGPLAKYSAAALAALCLLAPVLGYTHMLLVQHTHCPEHGELVHSAEGAVDPLAVDGSLSWAISAIARGSGGESESHGHDHCLLMSHRKAQAPLGADRAAVLMPQGLSPSLLDQEAILRSPLALYRLAPKNSPPA